MPHKAFVDSSNRRKSTPHAHLRSETFPTPGGTQTTHTPLASVSARTHSAPATKAIAFPTSLQCDLIPWPGGPQSDSESECGGLEPEPRRTRARTGHVQTPRTTQPIPKRTPNAPKPKVPTTPKPKVPKRRVRTPKRSSSEVTASRIAALVESSIAHNLRMRAATSAPLNGDELSGDRHELFEQDELLMARLGATLNLRRPVLPPRAITISPRPPSSLLSGHIDVVEMPPPPNIPTKVKPSTCIRFIAPSIPACRRGSVSSNNVTLNGGPRSLPALVATLILRRNTCNERESATRRVVQPPPSPSTGTGTPQSHSPGTSLTSCWPRKYRHECHKPSPLVQITSLLLEAYVVL
ncbi:hypothetical protein C8R43DRAFT_1006147 [Mycena crocata]|nr:hypothetical protein C8R43DRAFT_1006147 [Mycena crocata]